MSGHLPTGEYYGVVQRRTALPDLVLSEILHTRPRKLPQHCHESAFFCLLLQGNYRERISTRTIEYGPFTLGFHPPALSHTDEVGVRGGLFFCVEVGQRRLEDAREFVSPLESAPSLCGEDTVWLATQLYRRHREVAAGETLAVESLVAEMLAGLSRRRLPDEAGRPPWLRLVEERLRSDFGRNWTLAELAGEAGIHPVHLSRVYRRHRRQTVGEHLNRMRVRFAASELASEGTSLAQLAVAAGFADQSHFTRVFKRLTGQTPAAFRAAMKAA